MKKSRRRSFVTITTTAAIISSCCNPSCPRDRKKAEQERPQKITERSINNVSDKKSKFKGTIATYPAGKSLNFVSMVNSQNVLYISGYNNTDEWYPLDLAADDVAIGPSGLYALRNGQLYARTGLNEDDYGRDWMPLGGSYSYIHSSSAGLFLIATDGKVFLAPLDPVSKEVHLDQSSLIPIQTKLNPSEISYNRGFLWIVSDENKLFRKKFDTANKNPSSWQQLRHTNPDLKVNSFSASRNGLWVVDKQGQVHFLQPRSSSETDDPVYDWLLLEDDSALDSSSAIISGVTGVWLLRGNDLFLRLDISPDAPMGSGWKAIGLKGILAFDNGI